MSLTLIIQKKESILISADSRSCIEENGKYYADNDNVKKIYSIDGKVIFIAGSAWISDQILKQYTLSSDKSIEKLKSICKSVVDEFITLFPDISQRIERKLELIVATFENDVSVIYSISSSENFKLLKIEGDDIQNVICLGTHRDEALRLYNMLNKSMPIIPMYMNIYNSLADEQMGGKLTVYSLTKDGLNFRYVKEISDSKFIERYSDKFKINTLKNATTGISIQKGDGSGSNWQDMFYVDTEGNQHMKNTYIELVSNLATILLDPNIGIKISNSSGDVLYIDPVTGKLKLKDIAIEITTSDGKNKIIIDASNGCKIQKNTGTAWEDVSYQDTDGNMILKGDLIAGKLFGATKDSAYIQVGGVGNFGDLKLYRSGEGNDYPVFGVYDEASIIDLKAGLGDAEPTSFLSVTETDRYPIGTWNCSGAQFIYLKDSNGDNYVTQNWVNNAIAAHVAAYHT